MTEIWPAVIGVVGALLGSLLGGWLTNNATERTRSLQRRTEETDRLVAAISDALNAVLAYRAAELRRAHEAIGSGLDPDNVDSALAAREARRFAMYRLTILRILMPESQLADDLASLVQEVRRIGHAKDIDSALATASLVTTKVDSLAVTSGREIRSA